MTKFSSFLVFALGAVLIFIVGVNVVQRFLPREMRSVDSGPALPHCDLPPLLIEPTEVFHVKLDKIFNDADGLEGLRGFVEKEFVPGRGLILASTHKSEPARTYAIVDRELRRCDRNSVVLLNEPPVLPRTSAKPELGEKGVLLSWARPHLSMPVNLTVWCVPARE